MSGRGFPHEEWFIHVRDWFAVRRDMQRADAERLVADAEHQLGLDALRSWLPASTPSSDEDELRSELLDALLDGRLRLVKHSRANEPLRAPEIQDLVDLIETRDEDRAPRPWIEVCCLGPKGETYAFSRCRVRMPDGSQRYAQLDHRSTLRLEDVPIEGTCEFELTQDARPDGGRMSPPKPTARTYQFGTAAAVQTSKVHVLQLGPAWIEIEVLDTHGRPVPHFGGSLRASDGEHPVELDGSAVFRAAPLPDAMGVSVTLRPTPASPA